MYYNTQQIIEKITGIQHAIQKYLSSAEIHNTGKN
jgi:hypothetical protein